MGCGRWARSLNTSDWRFGPSKDKRYIELPGLGELLGNWKPKIAPKSARGGALHNQGAPGSAREGADGGVHEGKQQEQYRKDRAVLNILRRSN